MNEEYISLEDFQRNIDMINFDTCCSNKNSCMNRNEMLKKLKELRFSIIDISLYLDTHPDDRKAIEIHKNYTNRFNKLSTEYEKIYGPLSIMFPCNKWRWLEEPWPWENNNCCERGDM